MWIIWEGCYVRYSLRWLMRLIPNNRLMMHSITTYTSSKGPISVPSCSLHAYGLTLTNVLESTSVSNKSKSNNTTCQAYQKRLNINAFNLFLLTMICHLCVLYVRSSITRSRGLLGIKSVKCVWSFITVRCVCKIEWLRSSLKHSWDWINFLMSLVTISHSGMMMIIQDMDLLSPKGTKQWRFSSLLLFYGSKMRILFVQ